MSTAVTCRWGLMDTVPRQRRSEIMARIRSKNTAPEMAVRRYFHAAGLRYRVHPRDLPGRPDIVFPSRRACVFVHGCFWHGCPNCIDGRRQVKSNTAYWAPKIAGNQARDARHYQALASAEWTVWTLWECQVSRTDMLEKLVADIRALPWRSRNAGPRRAIRS
jgi:DNA mismatch endonuclease, patch repair protein